MMQVVLVGAGRHSTRQHAPSLRRWAQGHGNAVRLAAVCDLDGARAERARAEFGFERSFLSLEEMLDQVEPDAGVVVLQPQAMQPVLERFFSRRIPVLTEKPLGADIEQARAIAAAGERAGAQAMVSLNRRFDPALRLALEWARGRGPLRFLHGRMLRSRRLEPDFIWGTGIHLLDAMCHVAGPLELVGKVFGGGPQPPDAAGAWRVGLLRGERCPAASFEILPHCGVVEEMLGLSGEDWRVEAWTGAVHPWRARAHQGGKLVLERQSEEGEPEFTRSGACDETATFLEAVLAQRPLPSPTLRDALASAELAARLQEMRCASPQP